MVLIAPVPIHCLPFTFQIYVFKTTMNYIHYKLISDQMIMILYVVFLRYTIRTQNVHHCDKVIHLGLP